MKKFRRYSTPAGGNYEGYQRANSYDHYYRRDDRDDFRDARSERQEYHRYEETKNDYLESARSRDERPIGNFEGYFNDEGRDSPRDAKPELMPSSVNKKKWGQK